MICDLSTVLNNDGAALDISGVISPETGALGADIAVKNGISVTGKILCRGDVLDLSAHVESDFQVSCARCLKPIFKTMSFDFEETLAQEGEEITDRDSVIVFSGATIDLSEIVISNALLNLSYKYLCSEDCRGICPKCGADLNEGNCGCTHDEIDPRWEKLKNFK